MKKIVLKVEVPDILDYPSWLLEDLYTSGFDYDVERI